ncbi:MAG: hypothetical protein WA398_04930 [Nitrososphaeraceae archaeon]|jgi:hypothetical protein
MSGLKEIPENYELRKIVQELLKLLEQRNVLDSNYIERIIDKGRPKS